MGIKYDKTQERSNTCCNTPNSMSQEIVLGEKEYKYLDWIK